MHSTPGAVPPFARWAFSTPAPESDADWELWSTARSHEGLEHWVATPRTVEASRGGFRLKAMAKSKEQLALSKKIEQASTRKVATSAVPPPTRGEGALVDALVDALAKAELARAAVLAAEAEATNEALSEIEKIKANRRLARLVREADEADAGAAAAAADAGAEAEVEEDDEEGAEDYSWCTGWDARAGTPAPRTQPKSRRHTRQATPFPHQATPFGLGTAPRTPLLTYTPAAADKEPNQPGVMQAPPARASSHANAAHAAAGAALALSMALGHTPGTTKLVQASGLCLGPPISTTSLGLA